MKKWQVCHPAAEAGSPGYGEDRPERCVTEHIICHLVEDGGGGIERNAGSRHFDHTDIAFAIADCHGVCQADAKPVQNILKHIGFAVVVVALAEPVLEKLGGDADLSGGYAFLEFELITECKVEPEKILDMVGNSMIAIADDTADITAKL